jgi:hypothetical protein
MGFTRKNMYLLVGLQSLQVQTLKKWKLKSVSQLIRCFMLNPQCENLHDQMLLRFVFRAHATVYCNAYGILP